MHEVQDLMWRYPKPQLATPPRRPLLPKSSEGEVVLWCPIAARLFESERDFRYFRNFCEENADQISGPFVTSAWNRAMPQASEVVPFARHATIAWLVGLLP